MSFVKTIFTNECQIRMKWRISKSIAINRDVIKSDEFASNIPGVNYSLTIYPKIDKGNHYHQVKAVLNLSMGKTNTIQAAFTVSVKSANAKVTNNFVYSNNSTSFGNILCNRGEFLNPQRNFFVDEFVEIELEGTLKALGGIKRKAENFLSLAELLWESDDKDITIIVKDEQIKIHKWILCAKSPVFKAELNCGMKEAVEKKIEITDFCFETVKAAINFCYEQDITEFVNEEIASELLHFADKYNIKAFHDTIQSILIEKLSESNVCKLANISITSNATELRECCICFLVTLAKQSTFIDGIKELKDEIASEIGRRSFVSSCTKKL